MAKQDVLFRALTQSNGSNHKYRLSTASTVII